MRENDLSFLLEYMKKFLPNSVINYTPWVFENFKNDFSSKFIFDEKRRENILNLNIFPYEVNITLKKHDYIQKYIKSNNFELNLYLNDIFSIY